MRIPSWLSPIGSVNPTLAAPMIYRHPEFSYGPAANPTSLPKRWGIWSGLARLFGSGHKPQFATAGAYSSSLPTVSSKRSSILVMQMAKEGRESSKKKRAYDRAYERELKKYRSVNKYQMIGLARARMECMRVDLDHWAALFRDLMADELADADITENDWARTDNDELWKRIAAVTGNIDLASAYDINHGAPDPEKAKDAAFEEALEHKSFFIHEYKELRLVHAMARLVYRYHREILAERVNDTAEGIYETPPPGYSAE